METVKYDIRRMNQGATYAMTVAFSTSDGIPVPLTGCIATAQVRYKVSDPIPAATFTTHVDEAGGVVTLSLSASDTSALNRTYGVWDMRLEFPGGNVARPLEGDVTISLGVTR